MAQAITKARQKLYAGIAMSWNVDLRNLSARKLAELASMQPRGQRLTALLGARSLAALLDTDADDLASAAAGKSELPTQIARRMLDLDLVLARALQVMQPEVVIDWLEGTEPTFGLARPIDVLAMDGGPLLKVLDQLESGADA